MWYPRITMRTSMSPLLPQSLTYHTAANVGSKGFNREPPQEVPYFFPSQQLQAGLWQLGLDYKRNNMDKQEKIIRRVGLIAALLIFVYSLLTVAYYIEEGDVTGVVLNIIFSSFSWFYIGTAKEEEIKDALGYNLLKRLLNRGK